MSLKRFIKFFVIAVGFQIALQVIVSPLLSVLFPGGKMFPEFLDFYVYYPFINGVINAGGYTGESSMIWPPLLGTVLGIFVYSTLFALIIGYMTRESSRASS